MPNTYRDISRALQDRLDSMELTSIETGCLLSYLIGGAPEVVERGLDYVQRVRADPRSGDTEQ